MDKEREKRAWETADVMDYALLKANARRNRLNMTDAESLFWSLAKGSGLGEKCRRQYVIGQYIADFLFRSSMLIVEIDGGYHCTDEQQKVDAFREEYLIQKGYKIIRFKNEEVLFDTENIIKTIKNNLK